MDRPLAPVEGPGQGRELLPDAPGPVREPPHAGPTEPTEPQRLASERPAVEAEADELDAAAEALLWFG